MKNISAIDFKKKYPRQYDWLIKYYGGKKHRINKMNKFYKREV